MENYKVNEFKNLDEEVAKSLNQNYEFKKSLNNSYHPIYDSIVFNPIFMVFIFLFFISILSNPSDEFHKDAVKNKMEEIIHSSSSNSINDNNNSYSNTIVKSAVESFEGVFVQNIVEHTTRENYLIFSLTVIENTPLIQNKIVGFGAFGKVWINNLENFGRQ
jgi:hypothetical protein